MVELGCGAGGLCAMVGARVCRRYTATDGSPAAMRLLHANLRANAAQIICERVVCRQLAWGERVAAAQVRLWQRQCCDLAADLHSDLSLHSTSQCWWRMQCRDCIGIEQAASGPIE